MLKKLTLGKPLENARFVHAPPRGKKLKILTRNPTPLPVQQRSKILYNCSVQAIWII